MEENASENTMIKCQIEFSGGVELLFSNKKQIEIEISKDKSTLRDMILLLGEQCQKKSLFIKDQSIRPGILVLINEADWELEGKEDYECQSGDIFTFISTLHGG